MNPPSITKTQAIRALKRARKGADGREVSPPGTHLRAAHGAGEGGDAAACRIGRWTPEGRSARDAQRDRAAQSRHAPRHQAA